MFVVCIIWIICSMWILVLHQRYTTLTPRQISIKRLMTAIPAFFLANQLQKMYFLQENDIFTKYLFLITATLIFFVLNHFFLVFCVKMLKRNKP